MLTVLSARQLEEGRLGEYFRSRKNRVFRASVDGKDCVVKVFREGLADRAEHEYRILERCHGSGVPVPRPLALLEGAILMEHVPGVPVSMLFDDLVEASGRELSQALVDLAVSLATWLHSFHSCLSFEKTRGDAILRNFLMTDRGVVGLDFEEAACEDTLVDLGVLCASALASDPPFTGVKLAFAGRLVDSYQGSVGRDISADMPVVISKAIRHYAQYRVNREELVEKAELLEAGRISLG